MTPREIVVQATWDPEAGVFVAVSEHVPGLVAEAATEEELRQKLDVLIPELLELNGPPLDGNGGYEEIPLVIRSERTSRVRVHA